MNQLKLRGYFVESFRSTFPPFPAQTRGEELNVTFSATVVLYTTKKNENNFAIKLSVISTAKKNKSRKTRVYFEAVMIGIFRRLDESTSVKLLARTMGKDMLYEKMYALFSDILKSSPIKKFSLPLSLKQFRQVLHRP